MSLYAYPKKEKARPYGRKGLPGRVGQTYSRNESVVASHHLGRWHA